MRDGGGKMTCKNHPFVFVVGCLDCLKMESSNKEADDLDRRWEMIGALVERSGSEEEKISWALCRGDAAEWRYLKLKNL